MEKKDYSLLDPEALRLEEKKIRRKEIISAVLIGFLFGIIIYGVANNGFGFIYVVIPLILIIGIVRHSKSLKAELMQVRSEIDLRQSN